MNSQHYYTATISILGGVLLATFSQFSLPTLIWLMGGALVFVLLYRRNDKTAVWLYAGITLGFIAIGAVRMEMVEQSFGHSTLKSKVGQEVTLLGVVVREPEERANTKHLYVKTSEDLLLVTVDRYTKVAYGDEVAVVGKLRQPEPFTTDLGRTFNYPGYLLARGVEYQIAFAKLTPTGNQSGNYFINQLLAFKTAFKTRLITLIPELESGLGQGLLLGVKQALGEELELAFRQTGIIHIVVLSGYNVMLVVTFVMFILSYFTSPRGKVILGIAAIISFALLVGLSATVLRACLMATLLILAHAFGRLYLVLRILLLAAVMMVMINPFLLVYDVGFQLSFLATLGLLLLAPVIERGLIKLPKVFGAKTFLIATLSTQIAVLPLLLYQVGEFSVVSVLVNVLVLPIVPVAMLLTFATGLTAFISPTLASLLAVPAYYSLLYINQIALWFSAFSISVLAVPAFPFYIVLLVYFIMGVGLWYLYLRHPLSLAEVDLKIDLIKLKRIKEQNKELSTWQIEEEVELEIEDSRGIDQQKTESKPDSVSVNDTPIFFR